MDHNGNGWIRHAGRRTPPLIVAALMAVIALMASGAHAAAEETRTGVKSMVSADAVQAPVHRKYVKDNGDGTYDLTLNVRGDSPWLEAKNGAPKDVVLVVEKSSLMNKQTNSGRTRWDAAKHTATALVQRLLTSENGKQDAARRTIRLPHICSERAAPTVCGPFRPRKSLLPSPPARLRRGQRVPISRMRSTRSRVFPSVTKPNDM